jgi:hypothetical protein
MSLGTVPAQLGVIQKQRVALERATLFFSTAQLVAGARFVPNTQFLSIPFRSELLHCAAQV